MSAVHLAQINIGTMRAPTDDPSVAEFMDNLERVNAQADAAPGFVWRLQTDEGNATAIQIFPDPLQLVNMSVWESVETLRDYVYRTEHVEYFRRRTEWFQADAKRLALWWVPAGVIPTLPDAVHRVAFLHRHGPSPYAFDFAHPAPPLVFEPTTPDDPDTARLIGQLNQELRAAANDPSENHFGLDAAQATGDAGRMLRARYSGELVGCGAVRRIDDGASSASSALTASTTGELKRMFVDPSARGLRIGAALLDQLELAAVDLGLTELKLETGPRQVAAQALYQGAGYAPTAPWGEYLATPDTSLCFAKTLAPVPIV